jgi:tetrahydromethanopterin S-methyltransferase subunit G
MKRIKSLLVVAVLSSFLFSSCGSSIPYLGPSMDLINGMSSLGISQEQAIGGVGALLTLAKGKLSPSDYLKVGGAIPYSNTLMKAAKDMGVPMSITDLADVTKVFKDLDMSPDMVGKMIPEVTKFAGKKGGEDVTNLLMGVLK